VGRFPPTDWLGAGVRYRRCVRAFRSTLVVVAASLSVACAGAVAAPHGPAVAAASHIPCSKLLPVSDIEAITGEGAALVEAPAKQIDFGRSGTLCSWGWTNAPNEPNIYTQAAWVEVGYGESSQSWQQLLRTAKKGGGGGTIASSIGCAITYSPLSLGAGVHAYVDTMSLSSGGYVAYGGLPQDALYMVTVLTKHHDVLRVALTNATLAATTTAVKKALGADPSF